MEYIDSIESMLWKQINKFKKQNNNLSFSDDELKHEAVIAALKAREEWGSKKDKFAKLSTFVWVKVDIHLKSLLYRKSFSIEGNSDLIDRLSYEDNIAINEIIEEEFEEDDRFIDKLKDELKFKHKKVLNHIISGKPQNRISKLENISPNDVSKIKQEIIDIGKKLINE
ncbi:MAG: hypothetical protein GY714_09025 [Desulfobacterales bacterium]|nr:hypothetical protein [Desulfobacterales bacterium]